MTHELSSSINVNNAHAEVFAEHVHHHLTFVQAQQAVINKDAGELIANGAMDQCGRHAAVDTAGQT